MNVAPRVWAVVAAGVVLTSAGCGASSPAESAPTSTVTSAPRPTPARSASVVAGTPTPDAAAPSALQVLEKAKSRAKATTSGAYEARFIDGKLPVEVSFRGSRTDYRIDLKVGSAEATFVVHGSRSYTRGNSAFWSQAKAPDPGKETFVQVPTSELGPATDFTLESRLRWLITSARSRMQPVVSGGETKGFSVWTLTSKGGARSGTLYISKDSYDVIRFSVGNQEMGAYEFHGWGDTFEIPTPPKSHVVKGPSLQSRSRSSA